MLNERGILDITRVSPEFQSTLLIWKGLFGTASTVRPNGSACKRSHAVTTIDLIQGSLSCSLSGFEA